VLQDLFKSRPAITAHIFKNWHFVPPFPLRLQRTTHWIQVRLSTEGAGTRADETFCA
jgi:hypothetical protein